LSLSSCVAPYHPIAGLARLTDPSTQQCPLNAMARSIGQSDLYPFVLSPIVVEKLDFVHGVIAAAVSS
jgi:hypothetical protein